MPTSGGAVTGGAKRKKKTGAKKKAGAKKKRPHRKTGGATRDLTSYKKEAQRLGIPLSKAGHTRTKAELARAISYRHSH